MKKEITKFEQFTAQKLSEDKQNQVKGGGFAWDTSRQENNGG